MPCRHEAREVRLAIDRERFEGWRRLAAATQLARSVAEVSVGAAIRLASVQRALVDAATTAHLLVLGEGVSELGGDGIDRALSLVDASVACPVVVVSEAETDETTGGVLALADGSGLGRRVVAMAADVAEGTADRLLVLPVGRDAEPEDARRISATLAAMESDLLGTPPAERPAPLAEVVAEERARRAGVAGWTVASAQDASWYLDAGVGRPRAVVVDARFARECLARMGAAATVVVLVPVGHRADGSLEQILRQLETVEQGPSALDVGTSAGR